MPDRVPTPILQHLNADQLAQRAADVLPEGDCCAKCRFNHVLHQGDQIAMICRRYPAKVTLIAVPAVPPSYIPRRGEQIPMTFANQPLWSPAQPDWWCGEFNPWVKPT